MEFSKIHTGFCPFLILAFAVFASGCGSGSLNFTANGESFVTEGFTSRDGWDISFSSVVINIYNPTAYHPSGTPKPAALEGEYQVDLAEGTPSSPAVSAGLRSALPPGNYQSLKFGIKRISSGKYSGSSIILRGVARQNKQVIPFLIRLDEELFFNGEEGYVGDSVKGIVRNGEVEEIEMTFHIDHIFGDASAPRNSHVNTGSPGFSLFYDYLGEGKIEVTQAQLRNHPSYDKLLSALKNLGHLGEGHCIPEEPDWQE